MNPLPTLDVKGLKLEADIATALREGFAKTFGDSPSPFALEVATKFAQNAAPGIKDAILDFVKTLIVNVPAAPITGACAAGPVSGTANIADPMITIG